MTVSLGSLAVAAIRRVSTRYLEPLQPVVFVRFRKGSCIGILFKLTAIYRTRVQLRILVDCNMMVSNVA
jgi:hypothetical protein